VWRGINVVDGSVFQPSVAVSYSGLTGAIWGNMDLSDVNGTSGKFTEIDVSLDYSWSCDPLTFSVGAIYYTFPNTGAPSTTEIYGAVGVDTVLSPTLTVYQDIDEADGTYVSLGVGHTFENVFAVSDDLDVDIDVSGAVGYGSAKHNAFYYGTNSSGFTDLLLSVAAPMDLGKGWTLTPMLSYSRLLDGDIRTAMGNDDNFWAGLSLSWAF
jgi:hypothetical protein